MPTSMVLLIAIRWRPRKRLVYNARGSATIVPIDRMRIMFAAVSASMVVRLIQYRTSNGAPAKTTTSMTAPRAQ